MTMMTPPPPLDEDEEMLVPNSDYTDGIDTMEPAQGESVSTVENQPTEEPPLFKFTWPIEHVSRLNVKKCYSDVFIVGGYKWRVLIFPKGNNVDHLSIYLDVADSATLPYGWSRYAFFSLAIVNQIHHKFTVKKETQHQFNARESDWGFTSFMPLLDVYDPTKGYLIDDTLIVEAEVSARRVPDYWAYDSKKQTGFVGLKNQGATCYMNSLLQTLYHIPYFRKAVYHMPTTENDIPSKSIPLALQSLFYKVQYSDTSVSTKDLTKSFGWDTYDSFMQHDVQELNRVLCEKLEDKMKGTAVEDTIKHLFEGHHMNYIECINVDYKSTRKESFYDLQLDVKGCRDVYASFDKYVEVEQLDGDNKYHAEQYGLQDARKGVLFLDFPPVLQLQLKRFEYDFMRDTMVKINDRYEFPLQLDLDRDNGKYLSPDADRSVRNLYTLHSVLVHSGGVHGGHYYAFIRPTLSDQWYKFDDERVTKEEVKRALEEQYGGEEELPQPNPGLINSPGFINTPLKFTKYSNAYMLVYIRESEKDKIIYNVDEKDLAEHLRVRLKKEQEEKEKKQKEKTEAHLYTIIKVARDEDLARQIGKDIYFDLVDHDELRSFHVQKQQPFTSFKEEAAKEFGIPVQYQRFWLWGKRQNQTYRPKRPLTPLEESQSVDHLREVSSKVQSPELKLFMEVKHGPDLCFLPPPEKEEDDILLFFKLYDPEKESLRYVGRSFEKAGGKPADILLKLNEMAGFPPDTEIELYEEIKFEPCVMCERIDKRVPFRNSQIADGDIICFQRVLSTDEEEWYEYPYVQLFLEDVHNRQVRLKKEQEEKEKKRKEKTEAHLYTIIKEDKEMLVPNSDYTDGIDTVEPEVSAGRVPDYWAYDSKKQKGFVGLENQGAIYYMNSLLQTLYHIPSFRKAVYHMPTTENDIPSKSIPLALQSLFYAVQYSETSFSTRDLTKSFEWDTYGSFMQHDVQQLKLVLFTKLEDKMKGTAVADTIKHLFEGCHTNLIHCIKCFHHNIPAHPNAYLDEKSFYELRLDVKGCRDVYASFDKYIEGEGLDNIYHAVQYLTQHVTGGLRKGVLFHYFPPVLQLQLKRFEFDFVRNTMVKINDRYEFPLQLDLDRDERKYLTCCGYRSVRNLYTLHSVLVHSGDVQGGHYYAFIRPTLSDQWYKFDNERVTKEEVTRALEEQYGGEEELPQPNPGLINTPSNAYMLVYIRQSDENKIICNVDEKDIVEHLRVRLKKEQEEK